MNWGPRPPGHHIEFHSVPPPSWRREAGEWGTEPCAQQTGPPPSPPPRPCTAFLVWDAVPGAGAGALPKARVELGQGCRVWGKRLLAGRVLLAEGVQPGGSPALCYLPLAGWNVTLHCRHQGRPSADGHPGPAATRAEAAEAGAPGSAGLLHHTHNRAWRSLAGGTVHPCGPAWRHPQGPGCCRPQLANRGRHPTGLRPPVQPPFAAAGGAAGGLLGTLSWAPRIWAPLEKPSWKDVPGAGDPAARVGEGREEAGQAAGPRPWEGLGHAAGDMTLRFNQQQIGGGPLHPFGGRVLTSTPFGEQGPPLHSFPGGEAGALGRGCPPPEQAGSRGLGAQTLDVPSGGTQASLRSCPQTPTPSPTQAPGYPPSISHPHAVTTSDTFPSFL